MSSFRTLLLVLACALALLPGPARAAGEAETLLRREQESLFALVRAPASPKRDAGIIEVFNRLIDYEVMAHDSLGKHFGTLSAPQQAEFSTVLRGLVQRAYQRNIEKTAKYAVTYEGQVAADAAVLVKTRAQNEKNQREPPVSIDYLMHTVDGRWKVRDVVTEGSSMVRSYRSQFSRIIDKHGFDELIRRMKRKLERG